MKRRLPILTPLLLLLFIAVCVLWLRSHVTADCLTWINGENGVDHAEWHTVWLTSSSGGVQLWHDQLEISWTYPQIPQINPGRFEDPRPQLQPGFTWSRSRAMNHYPAHRTPVLGFAWGGDELTGAGIHHGGTIQRTLRRKVLTVPYWSLALLVSLPVIPRLPRLWRTGWHHRHRQPVLDGLLAYGPFIAVATFTIVVLNIPVVFDHPVLSIPILTFLLIASACWGLNRSDLLAAYRRQHPPPPPQRCPHCNYDLRATPNQCPECGAVPHQQAHPRVTA